ncbi:divalent-cation tolerance protein CutA [Candidatus Saccharibacteria bacterium]|nr:divalent-cation tolerance protein CutA [Candidatus Saccharibacteria bacterium]
MSEFCQVWLSCGSSEEASKIASVLLEMKLIACAKQLPIMSDYRWQDAIEHDNEVLLVMETRLELFEQIEAEVAKLHSYETFVLQAIPIVKLSKAAEKWWLESTTS